MSNWSTHFESYNEQHLNELLEFLRIPSISSLPDHADAVREAGQWVAARMQTAGIENIQTMETGGHPVVYGDWLHAPEGSPTVMIYGHFDTQPVDPLELWSNPPFEPQIRDGRIYARGASDDKGNMFVPILAVEALLATEGKLPINLKFFFEGQEEIGSPQLPNFIEAHKDFFACDTIISADGGQYSEDEPALLIGLRGLCSLQIDVQGAGSDLHSGMYGGAVMNPLHALAQIIASMRSVDGKILVDGFYDNVRMLSDEDRALLAKIPQTDQDIMDQVKVDALFGEPGYTMLERRWARPTLEVNGMWGGFQGEGVKTVLPNEAHAKITCRLVADQDPQQVVDAITAHVKKHSPAGVRVTVTPSESMAKAYLMPTDYPGNEAAAAVHQELYGKEPYYIRTGGSIPFCSLFREKLGVYTVNFAFGLQDERAHAPDEFWRLSSFERAKEAYCMLLHELAQIRF